MPFFKFSRSLVHLFLFTLFSLTIDAAPTYVYHFCLNETTFTPNTTYQTNLNLLLSSLSSTATIDNGFYKSTAGRIPPNIVYGVFLCRGDVTIDTCQDCVRTASKEIVRSCPTQKAAIIWYDECLLHYSNQSFFASVDQEPEFSMRNTQIITEPTRFNQLVGTTMNDIATRAANDPSGAKKFATNEVNISASQTLYSLAQCAPDLSSANCNRCLRGVIANLQNCCSGSPGARLLNPSCNVRYETYPFYDIVAPTPGLLPPPPPPPPPVARPKGSTSQNVIIIIISVVVFVVFIISIGIYLRVRKARGEVETVDEISSPESLQFKFDIIRHATDNFSDANKLGKGGFGVVYKGKLSNGQDIAVKRLSTDSRQGEVEFKNEVSFVAKLQHRNLVRLLGFCIERAERLLIYEFVPNSSLHNFIFDPIKRAHLDWETRHRIIGGIARGLLYLHEDSRLRIIHRDLKAGNILLDAGMNPKISDFGMARLFAVDQTQEDTDKIAGTFGYMAPEYVKNGLLSVKSDVFSFGVLVLEIVSGQKISSFHNEEEEEHLLTYAWENWRKGNTSNLIDPTLKVGSRSEMTNCINIGLLCVQENVDDRPTMSSVVTMFNSHSYSVTLPGPSKPGFFIHNAVTAEMSSPLEYHSELTESNQLKMVSIPLSVNAASITELYPR